MIDFEHSIEGIMIYGSYADRAEVLKAWAEMEKAKAFHEIAEKIHILANVLREKE